MTRACDVEGPAPSRPWVLYLIECAGDRLYAGITNDLAARFVAHQAGRGARFTKAFAPLRIVAAVQMTSRSHALKAECALKRRPRADKLRFLASCGTPLDVERILQPCPRSGNTARSRVGDQGEPRWQG